MTIPTIDGYAISRLTTNNLGGFMSEHERNILVSLARIVMPKVVLEIGVQEGQAARMLLDNVPSIERYVGVDTEAGYVPGIVEQAMASERPVEPGLLVMGDVRFERILKPHGSYDLEPDLLGSFDMMLIDGDHCHDAVMHDTQLADKVIRNGGLIVWHDYGAWCNDINEVLDSRYESGHRMFHATNTMLAWELT